MRKELDPRARALMVASRRFNRLLMPRSERVVALDLRPGEVFLLMNLRKAGREPGLQPSELAARLEVTAGHITQLITSLEGAGLVMRSRDPEDRRAVRVGLTDEGRKVMDSIRETWAEAFAGLIDELGAEDCDRLISLLDKASDYFCRRGGGRTPACKPGFEGRDCPHAEG